MTDGVSIDESSDGWTFRIEERLVTQLCVDSQFSLHLAVGAIIAIGEPYAGLAGEP
jgi:hypothetical protein